MATSKGVAVTGSDGSLYFIPNEALAAYQLTDTAAEQVRAAMATQDEVQGYSLPEPLPQARRLEIALGLLQFRGSRLVSATPMPLPGPEMASVTPIQLP